MVYEIIPIYMGSISSPIYSQVGELGSRQKGVVAAGNGRFREVYGATPIGFDQHILCVHLRVVVIFPVNDHING